MAENYVLLETIELTQSATSLTFDNIPQTGYTDLKIVGSARVTDAGEGSNPPISRLEMTFNNTTGYSNLMLYVLPGQSPTYNSAGGGMPTPGDRNFYSGAAVSSSGTANTYSNFEIYIAGYTSSNYKPYSIDNTLESMIAGSELDILAGLWSNTSAITSIKFNPYNQLSFAVGTTFSLYAIANANATPAVAPFATGGNIVGNDGTYWYHTFLSSGTFTPQIELTCDYLVVAGGGAGGSQWGSGTYPTAGGGAGGLRSTVGSTGGGGTLESALSLTTQSYSVTVGAGGTTAGANGKGNSSTFTTITSIGGGGGGYRNAPSDPGGDGSAGGNGGSGGGGINALGGGTGTANQGYAGGAGVGFPSASSGGGAGGAGSNGNGAAGGAGLSINITGSSVTYAAGGSQSATSSNVPGTPGTGNGGGGRLGGPGSQEGYNGGSGVVIIRYPMAS